MKLLPPEWYEREVLIHRYLYYVLNEQLISDFEYDIIEYNARSLCPPESPVHGVGSSLPSSYPTGTAAEAVSRLADAREL